MGRQFFWGISSYYVVVAIVYVVVRVIYVVVILGYVVIAWIFGGSGGLCGT